MKGRTNRQNGGSLASDYVMEAMKRPCDAQFPAPEKLAFNASEIVSNYGSQFKTTGGARKQNGGLSFKGLEDTVRSLVDNRVLDLYLKYMGITLLTPQTLVPIALIMGKKTFEQVIRDMRENEKEIQQGGKGFLDVKVPIIDDTLIGTGLKLAGLTALNVAPHTLVPLGLLMYVYTNYMNGKQEGGARHMTGDVIPPNKIQDLTSTWAGQDVPNVVTRGHVYNNDAMQLTQTLPPQQSIVPPYSQQIETQIFAPNDNICSLGNCGRLASSMAGGKKSRSRKGSRKQRGGASSDWISSNYSRGPINTLDMDAKQFAMHNQTAKLVPNDVLNMDTNASNRYYNFGSYANKVDYNPLYLQGVPPNGPQPNSS